MHGKDATTAWHTCRQHFHCMLEVPPSKNNLASCYISHPDEGAGKCWFLAQQVVQKLQQTEALRQLALIMGRASGKVFKTETVKRWTLKEYVDVHFQVLNTRW